ncbi:hypothetical protein JVT61DRAFT_15597 [Boletus reticuloceps]|uniref:Uncharacterized protein n=1 Tax=Boletus reticuloceps TaxID=495285 RepID=A0A8I2YCA7_9AGAM|nr:hypothetical protein JVT61DRAFT_15597 [Boletus reticuloceps]
MASNANAIGSKHGTLYCQEATHVDPSKGCPSAPITKCAILAKLQMYFGPYGFVCEKCAQMYPPSHLERHVSSEKHAQDLCLTTNGKKKREILGIVVSHLLTAHGVPPDVLSFDLPPTIPELIPGLTASLSYRCPVCPVPRWFSWKSLGPHFSGNHTNSPRPEKQTMKPRYIIRPYRLGVLNGSGGRSELSDIVIMLPGDWTPTNSDSSTQTFPPVAWRNRPLLPTSAPHLKAIGWYDYLQSLRGADVSSLMQLIAVRTEKDAASFLRKRATLEKGMNRIRQNH